MVKNNRSLRLRPTLTRVSGVNSNQVQSSPNGPKKTQGRQALLHILNAMTDLNQLINQIANKNTAQGSQFSMRQDNAFSITNASGKDLEVYEILDISTFLAAYRTGDVTPRIQHLEVQVSAWTQYTTLTSAFKKRLTVGLIWGSSGMTIANTEGTNFDTLLATACSTPYRFQSLGTYPLDYKGDTPYWNGTAVVHQYESLMKVNFDLTEAAQKFCTTLEQELIGKSETYPALRLVGILHASDNGDNVIVYVDGLGFKTDRIPKFVSP